MAKSEGANVSRCYEPNLRRFWIVKLPAITPIMARHMSQVVFSRRVLQDFAIYNQAHFSGMI